jgi:hypothetical protein
LGPLHAALREFGFRRAGFAAAAADLGKRAGADSGALQAWGALYGDCERWRLLSITQRAAVAFNIGALGASFYSVAVTALAFAWSTTLDLDAATVHGATSFISFPWFWMADAVPSLGLVEASHYFPGGQYDPALLGDWWPFLLASLLTYGLLPRTVLWLIAERRGSTMRANLPLDHGDTRLVYQRLTTGWATDGDSDAASLMTDGDAAAVRSLPGMPEQCRAILWADAPLSSQDVTELIRRRTGCSSVALVDGETLPGGAIVGADEAVVILAEAWEAPTRALGQLLGGLRAQADSRTTFVVLLIDADEENAAVWRRYVAALGDAYLFVDDGLEEGAV